MHCPACKLENPPTARSCDCGFDFKTGERRPMNASALQTEVFSWRGLAILGRLALYVGGGLLLFCMFFHVVPKALVVFPKEHATFANTFVDSQDYIDRWNNDFLARGALLNDYVFKKLQEEKVITSVKTP